MGKEVPASTVTFDVETTIKHKGHPFTASNKLVCYSVQVEDGKPEWAYFTEIEFSKRLREAISKARLLVGFNLKYDLHWARRLGILPPEGVRVWDCQIAEFLIRGQTGAYPSLNEALARFDLGQKDDKIAEYWDLGIDTPDIPQDELRLYNDLDVALTYKLYLKQREVMSSKLQKLCMVMGLDLLVLEEMEWNGVKLNRERCEQLAEQTANELAEITTELYRFSPTPLLNFDSGHHLSCLLYGGGFEVDVVESVERVVYKSGAKKGQEYDKKSWRVETCICQPMFVPIKGSKTKLVSKTATAEYPVYATGEDVLKQLKCSSKAQRRLIQLLLLRAEKEKLLGTYYSALPALIDTMEWEDGCLHGNLNQVTVRTGRLSSSNPNMQNFSSDVDEVLVSRFVS